MGIAPADILSRGPRTAPYFFTTAEAKPPRLFFFFRHSDRKNAFFSKQEHAHPLATVYRPFASDNLRSNAIHTVDNAEGLSPANNKPVEPNI